MLWAGPLAFLTAFVALRVLLMRFSGVALDAPNDRSLHARPVPRTGGIAVLLGASVALALGAGELWRPFALAAALAALSFADDLRGLPTGARLAGHFAAAAALAWFLLAPMHPLQLALLVVAVVWITNLFNFMDGSDGVAAGMAAIGFGAYALAARAAGDSALPVLAVALAAAALAFLGHNFHPARIFLGDVGSIPLGFLAAALGMQGWRDDLWPLWFPVLVFAPFIADATVTLVKRMVRGERFWHAHREHYYQRLVRMGFGQRRTALVGYALMAACAGAALAGRGGAPLAQALAFAAGSALLGSAAVWVDLRWARFQRAARAAP